jgi:hypothetical protein
MEEVEMQKEIKEEPKEIKKVEEVKEVEELKEVPKGYYLAEVPTSFANVIALDNKQISVEELIIKIANAVKDAGLMK